MSPFSDHSVFGWSWSVSITSFAKLAWHETGDVFNTPFSFLFISFVETFPLLFCCCCSLLEWLRFWCFHWRLNVSVFKSLHLELCFQICTFSIVLNGNTRRKQKHSIPFSRENGEMETWSGRVLSHKYHAKISLVVTLLNSRHGKLTGGPLWLNSVILYRKYVRLSPEGLPKNRQRWPEIPLKNAP